MDFLAKSAFVIGILMFTTSAFGILYVAEWGAMDTVVQIIPNIVDTLPNVADMLTEVVPLVPVEIVPAEIPSDSNITWFQAAERNTGISAKFIRV